ncbi:hypothetical protein ACOMHN_018709 [Nucella lapillus]
MKSKLIEHYGDGIVFAQSHKKADVISFKRTAESILREFYKEGQDCDPEAEKKRIIKAAASLIQSDIASLPSCKEKYPDSDAIKDHIKKTTENTVIQYMADNVDHDTATLDGRGTFHGMGIIASVTPGVKAARRVP